MKKFNLMRRLSPSFAERVAKNSFYEWENRPQKWISVNATGKGLIDVLEEAEKRIKGVAGHNNDAWHGEHNEYFLTVDDKIVLSPDDLISMLEFYIEFRGANDDDFVSDYFAREAKSLLKN